MTNVPLITMEKGLQLTKPGPRDAGLDFQTKNKALPDSV